MRKGAAVKHFWFHSHCTTEDQRMNSFVTDSEASTVSLILGIAMMASWWIGIRMGRSLAKRNPRAQASKFDDVTTAMLGLLLAFTFGISIEKHDQRRLAVVEDSNAIGDFYTCATLLKEPTRTALRRVIRDYTELRADLPRKKITDPILDNALKQFGQMQSTMTDLVAQALRDGTPIAVSLTNTLNGLTSNHASRLAAIRDRLPDSVLALLWVASIITTLLIGREQGLAGGTEIAGTICFIVLVCFAIYTTLDLNQPDRGLITISQEPMVRLLASMPKE